MNIVKVWDADYPWDIRVEKIIKTLSRNGHSVSVVCRNLNRRPVIEMVDGIKFYRLPHCKNGVINHGVSFPFFFNPIWLRTIYAVVHQQKADIILVRDLPMTPAGIIVGKFMRVPVVIDMAENYPAMLKDSRRFGKYRPYDVFVRNPWLGKLVENLSLKHVQKIIVVAEENKDRLLQKGVSNSVIYMVSNTPEVDNLENFTTTLNHEEKFFYKEKFTLIYVGGLGPIRGLEMVIESMPKILQFIPEAHLLLIGRGEKLKILMSMVAARNIEHAVTFKGWVDNNEIYHYIRVSKVGLIPHRSTEHTNSTLPNKLFDFMACGIPVVASALKPIQRIVASEKCGVTFKAHKPDDFISAVLKVRKRLHEYGRNGQSAVKNRYNWAIDTDRLLRIFS